MVKYWDDAQHTQYVLLATSDAGAIWNVVKSVAATDPAAFDAARVTCAGADDCWWVVNDTLYGTRDGGATWRAVTTQSWLASAIQLDFISSSQGWAIAGTYGDFRLMTTGDDGVHWTAIAPGMGKG